MTKNNTQAADRQPTSEQDDQMIASSLAMSFHEVVFLESSRIEMEGIDDCERIQRALAMIREHSDSESGSILLAAPDEGILYFADAWGPKAKEVMDFRVPIDTGLAGFCARTGTSVLVNDAREDARFDGNVAEEADYRISNICAAPIQEEGFVFGVIQLMNKKGGTYSEAEVRALTYLGRVLGRRIWESAVEA